MQRLVLIGSNVVVMWCIPERLDLSHETRTLESGAKSGESLESLEMVGQQRGKQSVWLSKCDYCQGGIWTTHLSSPQNGRAYCVSLSPAADHCPVGGLYG